MTKVSSKGQIVIPGSIRKEAGISEGDPLAVYTDGSMIYIKKVDRKKLKREFLEISSKLSKIAKEKGYTPEDVQSWVDEVRYGHKDNDR
ncbi:MAG: AbrB/MazE/SpoVT family DNA-binding domain-containing protein [Thermoplasmatota archaeon]